ncbi:hypothetical protein NECAME_03398 [Necator americanus]|uniref:Uncharacterized protein n=1 Tax=Necator americanus TaxID=51031 RepID=W2T498_NECAM|nr:hypothetical protein NECAME_03398 [Necator americanus]ETN76728.1 hypothetical protein NECAME_03398 [Necator americanus]
MFINEAARSMQIGPDSEGVRLKHSQLGIRGRGADATRYSTPNPSGRVPGYSKLAKVVKMKPALGLAVIILRECPK